MAHDEELTREGPRKKIRLTVLSQWIVTRRYGDIVRTPEEFRQPHRRETLKQNHHPLTRAAILPHPEHSSQAGLLERRELRPITEGNRRPCSRSLLGTSTQHLVMPYAPLKNLRTLTAERCRSKINTHLRKQPFLCNARSIQRPGCQ